jgi:hypothetical protein
MAEVPKTRRWFRFSLRTLFVVVVLMACAAGWVVYHVNWVRQRHAVLATHDVAVPILCFFVDDNPWDSLAAGVVWR